MIPSPEKRRYTPPRLTSERIFLPALSGTTGGGGDGYGKFHRPTGK
jgi:hypothetical protein